MGEPEQVEVRPERRMGTVTATALVVASMVGAGVFTTTGLLLRDIPSAPGVLICWAIGGLAALCGALAYAELGANLPDNGGEYHYLSRLFHPVVGFLSAWVSLVVGFAAPLATVALAFGDYLTAFFPEVPPRLAGGVLIVGLSGLSAWRVGASAGFQNLFTFGKIALIMAFVAVGLAHGDLARLTVSPSPLHLTILSPGFAVGLLWVAFAYTGWSASSYVAGEVAEPERVLPRALVGGTLLVAVLYVALNAVFLAAAPVADLTGQIRVGFVAASHLLGPTGGRAMTAIVTLGLVSTVGAMIVTGPRIYEAVGRDFPRLRWLTDRGPVGGPRLATALQSGLALAMMFSARFDALLSYMGFTLSVFGALAVCGVFVLRRRGQSRRFRMPGYPVTPLLFVALMAWMVLWGLIETPAAALAGIGTVARAPAKS